MTTLLSNTINAETYRGLPPLAGLCSLAEAARPGLSVEENVRRLKGYHYSFKRLHEIFTARIPAEPIYELKTAFSHHAYLCTEHAGALAKRVSELREPPLGLEDVPDVNLAIFFDEILAAATTPELIHGLYRPRCRRLTFALSKHIADTNPLFDAPSVRLCRFALLELDDMNAFGEQSAALLDDAARQELGNWPAFLDELIERRRRTGRKRRPFSDGTPAAAAVPGHQHSRQCRSTTSGSSTRTTLASTRRHSLYDPRYPARAKTLMMFYKRLREIDVPEMMATIIYETQGKPWDYYLEMSRQLWDEARHAMMGKSASWRWISIGADSDQLYLVAGPEHAAFRPERHAVLSSSSRG